MKATDKERPIRRKIIHQWMALPSNKRQTVEQIAAFPNSAARQGGFARSRRDPRRKITE
jgi:hypothetical protein